MSRTSTGQVYSSLLRLLRFCDEHQVTQLFDGKTVDTIAEMASVAIHALQMIDKEDEEICRAIEPYLIPDNSCGALSNRLSLMLLGCENWRQPFCSLAEQIENIPGSDFPAVLRINIRSTADGAKFVGNHTLTLLVSSVEEIYVLESYIGQYSLTEFLKMSPVDEINNLGLNGFLKKLSDLMSDDAAVRRRTYQELFLAPEIPCCCYQVDCRWDALDPEIALSNLSELSAAIKSDMRDNLALAQNGFIVATKEALFERLKLYYPENKLRFLELLNGEREVVLPVAC